MILHLTRHLLLGLAIVLWSAPIAALQSRGDLIVERGYVLDPSGQWTVEQAAKQPYLPLHGPLGTGNKNIPTWLRLVVPAQPQDQLSLVLVIQPATVEDLQIFSPDVSGHWNVKQTGSRIAFEHHGRTDLNFAVAFNAHMDRETVLYVRIRTTTGTVHAQVLSPDEARDFDTKLNIGMGIYLGLALMFTALSGTLWWSTRNPLWGMAALFDLTTMLHTSLPLGLMAKYVLPEANDLLPTLFLLSSSTHLLVCCLVFSRLVEMLGAPRWASTGYHLMWPAYIVWLGMIATGHFDDVLRQVNLGVVVATLWGIPTLFVLRTPDALLRWMYRLLLVGLMIYLLSWILPILSARKVSALSLYPTLPSNLVTMIMVVLILARRTLLDAQERQRLEKEKHETEQRFALEQAHHAETSGMLSMIMHEMKNPLASIRMASELLSSGRISSADESDKRFRNIQDAVDGIDSVLQRCIDVDRLEQGALREERELEDVAGLLRQWHSRHRQHDRIRAQIPVALDGHIDARLMVLMLGNLVDNALKYSLADSTVKLLADFHDGKLSIEVRNEVGRAGFPDETRLFQKYYRSPTAQHGGGTGLGLYWVRQVATLVGGDIQYRRDADVVVFALSMPL